MTYECLKDYGFTAREIALVEKYAKGEGIVPRAMANATRTANKNPSRPDNTARPIRFWETEMLALDIRKGLLDLKQLIKKYNGGRS